MNHEEGLSLQPMIPSKRFDIFYFLPLTGGCSECLDAFRLFSVGFCLSIGDYNPIISHEKEVLSLQFTYYYYVPYKQFDNFPP